MSNNVKVIKKIVNGNLNAIYKSCKKMAKKWDKNAIPLNYLNEVIETVRPKETYNEKFEQFRRDYNTVLDTLYITAESAAKRMKSDSIPLPYLREYIKILKTQFNKAIE